MFNLLMSFQPYQSEIEQIIEEGVIPIREIPVLALKPTNTFVNDGKNLTLYLVGTPPALELYRQYQAGSTIEVRGLMRMERIPFMRAMCLQFEDLWRPRPMGFHGNIVVDGKPQYAVSMTTSEGILGPGMAEISTRPYAERTA